MLRDLLNRILQKLAFICPGGGSLRPWLHRRRRVDIGENVWIGQFVYLDENHPEGISIGENSSVGLRSTIYAHLYRGARKDNKFWPVIIGKNVFIGPHCVILPNVRIGEGAVIKAGTVVSKNVPPYTLYGSPSAEPLARITVPLGGEMEYEEFVKGLRPIRRNKKRKVHAANEEERDENGKGQGAGGDEY